MNETSELYIGQVFPEHGNGMELRTIFVAKGKVLEQIVESTDLQLLLEQSCLARAYATEKLNFGLVKRWHC
jgi:hypothetical protein